MGAFECSNHKMPIAFGMLKYLVWENLFGAGPMDLKVPNEAPYKDCVGQKTIFVNENAVSVFYPADPSDCKVRK